MGLPGLNDDECNNLELNDGIFMNEILQHIESLGIIPVVIIDDEANAEPLSEALLCAGLSTMEITFRTNAAKSALVRITKTNPSMLLGAGTVLTVDQAKIAIDAGARYVVSPGFNRHVVDHCLENGVLVLPGVITPTEIQTALDAGIHVVKFFPAEAAGGREYLTAVGAPFKNLRFIPTGGIDQSNFLSYFTNPQVSACGGSWMVKPSLISSKRFEEIRQLTSSALESLRNFRLSSAGNPAPNNK